MPASDRTTLEETNLPFPVRVGSTLATRLDRMGMHIVDLDLDKLKARAEKIVGSTAWNDPQFLDDMRTSVRYAAENPDNTVPTKVSFRADVMRRLVNFLKLQEAKKRHPDLVDLPIRSPLLIVGLPRTGTTLLQRLLSQDPASHGPALWELFNPVQIDSQSDAEQRRKDAISFEKTLRQFSPDLWNIHPMMTDEPDECHFLMPFSLADVNLGGGMPYFDWLMKRSAISDYHLHKQYFQALHYGKTNRRWVWKSPLHLPKLEDMLTVYPDACVISCHRGMSHVMASWLSFMAMVKKVAGMRVDLHEVGRDWLKIWQTALETGSKVRDQRPASRFFDVHYEELVLDPIAMVRRIYAHFGIELTVTAEAKMKSWLERDKQQERRGHRYTLEQYGLTLSDLELAFSSYIKRFNVSVD